jgi:peptidoglycan/xylan/chitin deacetylase (PgdA/CDA1 family)
MSLSKKIIRNLVFPIALGLNADNYFLKKTRNSCCIINFHGVRKTNQEPFNNRHLPLAEFENLIIYLKQKFDIVPLSKLFEIYGTKKHLSKKTIAITFDDGYANNFEIAFPVLKRHNIPATFYIISKCLTHANYLCWPDMIDLVKKNQKNDVCIHGHVFMFPGFYNKALQQDLAAYLKTCGSETEKIAYDLFSQLDCTDNEIKKHPELLLMINGEDISKFAHEPLIEFGAHSHTHCNMEFLDEAATKFELKASKEIIEAKTGKEVITFAFPDGSYLPETIKMARDTGYKNIAVVKYKYNENKSDPVYLSRFTVSNSTTWQSNVLRLAKEFDEYGFNSLPRQFFKS